PGGDGRPGRPDLRAERALRAAEPPFGGRRCERFGSPGGCLAAGDSFVWRPRRADRTGQSAQGPAVSVRLAASATGVSRSPASRGPPREGGPVAADCPPAGAVGEADEPDGRRAAWRDRPDAALRRSP